MPTASLGLSLLALLLGKQGYLGAKSTKLPDDRGLQKVKDKLCSILPNLRIVQISTSIDNFLVSDPKDLPDLKFRGINDFYF